MLQVACGKKRANRMFKGLEKLGGMYWLCATPRKCFFLSIGFQKPIVLFQNEIWLCETTKFLLLFSQLSIGSSRACRLTTLTLLMG